MITFEDFKKLELVTAKVIDVQEHPNADRLWVLELDLGGTTKQIVAGIKQHYSREDLTGKTIILVNNLEPATIRGVESNGMLLAAKEGEEFTVLSTERSVPAGSRVG